MGVVDSHYRYTQDLLALESCTPHISPNWCIRGPSPLRLNLLAPYLSRHPDPRFAEYVAHGLSYGFHIGFSRALPLRPATRNHPSSTDKPMVISSHVQDELRLGRLSGPIPQSLVSSVHTSPIGLVPKPHSEKYRLIVDLSFPRSHSVNDGISSLNCSLQYASVDEAVSVITQLGRGTHLIKLDMSNAYRVVPIHPDDQPLLGIQWQGCTFIDRALPFGLRSSPKIFNAIADFLTWVLYCEGVTLVLHYLDDFLIFEPPDCVTASRTRAMVESIFSHVGAPLAHHKSEGPATVLSFLGIQIDTVQFQLSLPAEKISRLQTLLRHWVTRKACTRKDLESLIGHLSHAATVIRPGRIFLHSLFSLMSRVSNPSHFIRLNVEARADIAWWQCLLQHWNGRSFFPSPAPTCHVYSDASGSYGCGALTHERNLWLQLRWPDTWSTIGIAAKELVPIIIAAAVWGPFWCGEHVLFHSDNEAVVTIIQRRHARHPLLTNLLRCLFLYASFFHFQFSAVHIPGILNTTADAISRNNLHVLSSSLPQATQTVIPMAVSEFLLTPPQWGSPNWTELFTHSLKQASLPLPLAATSQASTAT